ncbi:MAG: ABC transporter ATP-binding protein [Bryobacterales bacterium]|nr:ABC transporter ATP-binding protein [Bryobacterales bacterium]
MTSDSASPVILRGVSAAYGDTPVLRKVSLEIDAGELVALLGPSGCGKTTALKVIAGLLAPSEGEVYFGAENVTPLPAERRRAPMVFQKALLFPHLTVAENVAFPLDVQRIPTHQKKLRVAEALALVRLGDFGARLPRELSGGQEQRVALARAIVSAPRVMLLDEPFSALDETLRGQLRLLVREVQQRLGITTVFVTHDQREAATMSSRIALVLDGGIAQVGPARDFFTKPESLAVARFFGWQVLHGANGNWLAFRAEQARLIAPGGDAPPEGWLVLPAKHLFTTDLGTQRLARLRLAAGDEVEVEGPLPYVAPDAAVALALDPGCIREFPADAPATARGW